MSGRLGGCQVPLTTELDGTSKARKATVHAHDTINTDPNHRLDITRVEHTVR